VWANQNCLEILSGPAAMIGFGDRRLPPAEHGNRSRRSGMVIVSRTCGAAGHFAAAEGSFCCTLEHHVVELAAAELVFSIDC
jgi:hypothetical protein